MRPLSINKCFWFHSFSSTFRELNLFERNFCFLSQTIYICLYRNLGIFGYFNRITRSNTFRNIMFELSILPFFFLILLFIIIFLLIEVHFIMPSFCNILSISSFSSSNPLGFSTPSRISALDKFNNLEYTLGSSGYFGLGRIKSIL